MIDDESLLLRLTECAVRHDAFVPPLSLRRLRDEQELEIELRL